MILISKYYILYSVILTLFLVRVIIQFSFENKLKYNLSSIGSILFSLLFSFLFMLLLFKKVAIYICLSGFFSIVIYSLLSLTKEENETTFRRLYLSLLFGSFWVQSLAFGFFYAFNADELKNDI